MFKEMTTKKKIIIGVIVLAVIIICVILFIKSRNKKKQAAANKAEETIQRTVSAPINVVEKKKSQIVPEEDLQVVKSAPEAKLSVEAVIPEKKTVANPNPTGNNKTAPPAQPAPYKSVMGDEFMQNANEQN